MQDFLDNSIDADTLNSMRKMSLSDVRVNVGDSGATSSLGAQAYATGSAVTFADSPSQHSAAHELTHIIQQR